MNSLKAVFGEVAGLFVEDGSLALEIIAVVVLAGVCSHLLPDSPSAAGGILVAGCLAALAVNVARRPGAERIAASGAAAVARSADEDCPRDRRK